MAKPVPEMTLTELTEEIEYAESTLQSANKMLANDCPPPWRIFWTGRRETTIDYLQSELLPEARAHLAAAQKGATRAAARRRIDKIETLLGGMPSAERTAKLEAELTKEQKTRALSKRSPWAK